MRLKQFICCTLLVLVAGCSSKPSESTKYSVIALTNVRVIDGTGVAPRENATIMIKGDRIQSIQDASAKLPKNANVVDMTGKTVMPTLIAAHSHLGLTKDGTAGSANLTEENVLRQLKKFQDYGVGAVMSLGTDHDFIYELRTRRQKNEIQTPWILTAGHGFGMDNGAPPAAMGMDEVYRPHTIDQVKKDMEQLAAQHPDVVKVWVDDFGHSMPKKMDPSLYQSVIQDAHKYGLKVAAHVYYLEDAKRLAKDGVDIFAHSVRDKKVDAEFIALMKKNNIAYIPTLALDDAFFIYSENPKWMQEDFFKKALDPGVWEWLHSPAYKPKESSRKDLAIAKENVLALLKAGIRVGLGTDSGATVMRIQGFAEHRELELLVEAGLTPMQAIQAATSVNASILGISDKMGTIAAGKKADLLVLNINPLHDIRNSRNIYSVWLEGRPVSGAADIDTPQDQ